MDKEIQQLMKERQELVNKVCIELMKIEKNRRTGKWKENKNLKKN